MSQLQPLSVPSRPTLIDYYLILAGFSLSLLLIRLSPWARANYDLARSRGQHHHRALRGLAARWNRVLWRCWQDGTPYDPAQHRALQALLRPAA